MPDPIDPSAPRVTVTVQEVSTGGDTVIVGGQTVHITEDVVAVGANGTVQKLSPAQTAAYQALARTEFIALANADPSKPALPTVDTSIEIQGMANPAGALSTVSDTFILIKGFKAGINRNNDAGNSSSVGGGTPPPAASRSGEIPPPSLNPTHTNPMLASGSRVAMAEALDEMMTLLSHISRVAQQQANSMFLSRIEQLKDQVAIIIKEGQTKADEFRQIGYMKVAAAIASLSAAVLTGAASASIGSKTAESRANFRAFSATVDSVSKMIDQAEGAAEQFVHADYATKLAGLQASSTEYQTYMQIANEAVNDLLKTMRQQHDDIANLASSYQQLMEKTFRQGEIGIH